MRISDWSSDVCSSDLCHHRHRLHKPGQVRRGRNLPGPGTGTATRPAWPEPSGSPGDRSEEHTSELQSLMRISYAVFCLKKKKTNKKERAQTRHRPLDYATDCNTRCRTSKNKDG